MDFHKRFIKIDHQLIYELDENDEQRFQVTNPKTIKSIRKIPLSVSALQALKMQKKQMQKAGCLENHIIDGHSGNLMEILHFLHRIHHHFTQFLHRTTEKIQNHLKTYNFSSLI